MIKRVKPLEEKEMKKLYKCRVCGYVVERKDPPGICPACGVKGKIFEEFESPISQKRRKMLDLHVHPVMVHLPNAFVACMSLISFLRVLGIIQEQSVFMGMLRGMVLLLPFSAIFAALAGIFDGKLRFKRIDTPHLKKKLVLAGLFILTSASLFVIQVFLDLPLSTYNIVVLAFSAVLLVVALTLGLIGDRLIESKVRG
jgi:DNA-directed RNA polymerase subunit RPC12/RpoP